MSSADKLSRLPLKLQNGLTTSLRKSSEATDRLTQELHHIEYGKQAESMSV